MKYLYSVLFIIIICFISFISGYFYHKPEQIVKTVEVTKNIDRVVYRDYSTINEAACIEILKKYDNNKINIKYEVKKINPEYTDLLLKWDLYERNGEQDIKVPVYQQGNWKFYLIGGVAATAGAYSGYKIYKLLH